MKKLAGLTTLILAVCTLLAGSAVAATDVWEQVRAGQYMCVAALPNPVPGEPSVLLAGEYGAGGTGEVVKSIDGGLTWSYVLASDAWSLAVDPNQPGTVYAATLDGLFRSIDYGDTWVNLNAFIRAWVLVHPGDSQVIYGDNYKSVDGGQNWTMMSGLANFFPDNDNSSTMKISPVPPYTLYAVEGNDTMWSQDEGATWTSMRIGGKNDSVEVDPVDGRWTYFGNCGGGSQRHYDNAYMGDIISGHTHAFAIDPTSPNIVYTVTDYLPPLYRSTDNGATWSPYSEGAPTLGQWVPEGRMIFDATNGAVYLPTMEGLWRVATWGSCTDADADTYFAEGGSCGPADCEDNDPAINPGEAEICDGADNDCDTLVDDDDPDLTGAPTWYRDADADTFGDPLVIQGACLQPQGHVDNADDCDDADPAVNPDATEVCDGTDNNCDTLVDEGCSQCDNCHGFPPAVGSHLVGHATSDAMTCNPCHAGASSYGSTPSDNHRDGVIDVSAAVGYSDGGTGGTSDGTTVTPGSVSDDTCTSACHDGAMAGWDGTPGLTCASCHYWETTPTSAANVADVNPLSLAHNGHFDAGKVCADCHTQPLADTTTPRTHVTGTQFTGALDRAQALQDEAAVTRTGMVFTDATNTCSGTGLALGCHATGSPDWDTPFQSSDCVTYCHTDTSTASVNPVSGLHASNGAFPDVEGHDSAFGPGGAYGCGACHDAATRTTVSNLHQDGVMNNPAESTWGFVSGAAQSISLNALDNAADDTCTASCHSDNNSWARRWSTAAYSSATAPGSARCDVCHGDGSGSDAGWSAGVVDHVSDQEDPDATADEIIGNHTDGTACGICHGLGASPPNDNYLWATDHESGAIMMNGPKPTAGAQYNDIGGCANACHPESYTMPVSPSFTTEYKDFGAGCTPSPEICDGIDNDCDGLVDDDDPDVSGGSMWYLDSDIDGYGNPTVPATACVQPPGYVADGADCDDTDNLVNPGEAEICDDGIDNNCDGLVDGADTTACPGMDCSMYTSKGACNDDPDCRWEGSPNNGNCVDEPVCNPSSPDEAGLCDDGIDNDCDGLTDGADPDCPVGSCSDYGDKGSCNADLDCEWSGSPKSGTCQDAVPCTVTEDPEATCDDGIDNDCDGFVDGADADCPDVTEICDDGIDNDGDGKIDCSDKGDCRKDPACP